MVYAVGIGIVGAVFAIVFIYFYRWIKKLLLIKTGLNKSPIILATIGGFIIGWIGVIYPQTLFWSEGEMQTVLDRGITPLPHIQLLGVVPIGIPYSMWHMLGIGLLKFLAILVSICAGWPGGIIYPLFYAGASIGVFMSLWIPISPSLVIMCMMASVEVAITRTPWGTNIILLLVTKTFLFSADHAMSIFPIITTAFYTSLFITRRIYFYPNTAQHSRRDITYNKLDTDIDPTSEDPLEHIQNPYTSIDDTEIETPDEEVYIEVNRTNRESQATIMESDSLPLMFEDVDESSVSI